MECLKEVITWGEPKFFQPFNKDYMKKVTVGDLNSFLMLFFDNFSSLLAILAEMVFIPLIVLEFFPFDVPNSISGIVHEGATVGDYMAANEAVVWTKVCPGISIALLVGNLWYAAMAWKLAGKEGRTDVTALPYGINTPAGFLTVFMVQLSIMFKNNPRAMDISPADFADKSWKGACAANFIGGLFEISGILIGNFLRKNIPRAALFAPVVGVGFVWLGYNPLIDVMREPLVGFAPLFFTFSAFFANKGKGIYPNWLPMALVMMLIGTIIWWAGGARHDTEKRELNEPDKMSDLVDDAYEKFAGENEMEAFTTLGFSYLEGRFVATVFPIALQSFIETIENVEMAELTGDAYNVKEAMLADGMGTCIGAIFGSPIPTTVYIGHVRHKKAGAAWLYSVLNAVTFFILLQSGLMAMLFYSIDPVSVGCILIAVGLMIVQSAMEHSASRHYPCLMIGIMFLVSDMLYFDHFDSGVRVATRSIRRKKGVMNMAPMGGIMCSLMVTAILCDIVDSRYFRAGVFCFISGWFSFFGIMHGANYIDPDGRALSTIGTSDADFYTTDLGEITFSRPIALKRLSFQDSDDDCKPWLVPCGYDWKYRVDDLGFDDPFRCTPWNLDYAGAIGPGYSPKCLVAGNDYAWGFAGKGPAYLGATNGAITSYDANGTMIYGPQPQFVPGFGADGDFRIQAYPYNEGWRFGIAYFVMSLMCVGHYFGCKKFGVEPVMDNGYATPAAKTETKPVFEGQSAVA